MHFTGETIKQTIVTEVVSALLEMGASWRK